MIDKEFNMAQAVLEMKNNQVALFEYFEIDAKSKAKQFREFINNGFTPEQAIQLIINR